MIRDYDFVLDSSAWACVFAGAPAAARVREVLRTSRVGTSMLTIAELSDVHHRDGLAASWPLHQEFIEATTDLLPILVPVASRAGATKQERRRRVPGFGLVDAIILETARFHGAVLLTTDGDFRGLSGVELHPR